MIVADANLIAYLVLPGDRTAEAEQVLLKDPVWLVPRLWVSELRSVVSQYVRRGDLTLGQAVAAVQRAEDLIAGREVVVESKVVLELSSRSKCSTYDCEYVAVALELEVPLITADGALLRAFPRVAMTPAGFTA